MATAEQTAAPLIKALNEQKYRSAAKYCCMIDPLLGDYDLDRVLELVTEEHVDIELARAEEGGWQVTTWDSDGEPVVLGEWGASHE